PGCPARPAGGSWRLWVTARRLKSVHAVSPAALTERPHDVGLDVLVALADDGPAAALVDALAPALHRVERVITEAELRARVAVRPYDVVVLDAAAAERDLLALLEHLHQSVPRAALVVVAAEPSIGDAI